METSSLETLITTIQVEQKTELRVRMGPGIVRVKHKGRKYYLVRARNLTGGQRILRERRIRTLKEARRVRRQLQLEVRKIPQCHSTQPHLETLSSIGNITWLNRYSGIVLRKLGAGIDLLSTHFGKLKISLKLPMVESPSSQGEIVSEYQARF